MLFIALYLLAINSYRKAEAVVENYNRELAEWERKVKESRRPAEKELYAPPEREVSVTSSDGYRQRASRNPSTDPTTEKDSFNTESNNSGQYPALRDYIHFRQRNTLQDIKILQGVYDFRC